MPWETITTITLPIKGTFYYSASEAEKSGQLINTAPLKLIAEPDNDYDRYAVQIWSQGKKSLLLGYIPRTHSSWVSFLIHKDRITSVTIEHSYRQYQRVHIQCTLQYRSNPLLRLRHAWNQFLQRYKRDKMAPSNQRDPL